MVTMLNNMDDKKVQQLLKKLNLNVEGIEAEEVVIKTKTKNIIISKPQVMIADMMGKEVYQITGEVSESEILNEKDIEMVMEKTGKDRDAVVKKLEELNNDLARAIIELKKKE
jgi:alpha-NAC-related protein